MNCNHWSMSEVFWVKTEVEEHEIEVNQEDEDDDDEIMLDLACVWYEKMDECV